MPSGFDRSTYILSKRIRLALLTLGIQYRSNFIYSAAMWNTVGYISYYIVYDDDYHDEYWMVCWKVTMSVCLQSEQYDQANIMMTLNYTILCTIDPGGRLSIIQYSWCRFMAIHQAIVEWLSGIDKHKKKSWNKRIALTTAIQECHRHFNYQENVIYNVMCVVDSHMCF